VTFALRGQKRHQELLGVVRGAGGEEAL
jgi:hypothetical protein